MKDVELSNTELVEMGFEKIVQSQSSSGTYEMGGCNPSNPNKCGPDQGGPCNPCSPNGHCGPNACQPNR